MIQLLALALLSLAFDITSAFTTQNIFIRPSLRSISKKPNRRVADCVGATSLSSLNEVTTLITDIPSIALSYSDDPLGDIISTINVPILGATLVGIAAVGLSFARLIPSLGAEAFVLTEEEEAATSSVRNAFDNADWEKEEVEEGTKGYINRRRQANEAKEKYQEGKVTRDVKDKSLRYSETNLDFLAVLLRAARPQRGGEKLGSGSVVRSRDSCRIYLWGCPAS
jgi:hypothetical protein